jgi:hypothetical protein
VLRLLLALLPAAFAHGPLPEAVALSGQPPSAIRTTHGLLRADGAWRWICPEAFGAALPGDPLVLSTGRLLVGTTAGVRWTDDGCAWAWGEGVDGYVAQLGEDGPGVWGLTQAAIVRSEDGGASWSIADPVADGASLRAFVRGGDVWWVAGWSAADAPALWIGAPGGPWEEVAAPIDVGQLMEPLGVGPGGRAWFNYPVQGIGTVVAVSASGEVEVLVEDVGDVGGLVVDGDAALLGTRQGLLRSDDGGRTWAAVDGAGLNRFGRDAAGGGGCMDALAGVGAVARWSGAGWSPVLELADVQGPEGCGVVSDDCAADWEDVHAAFVRGIEPPRTQASEEASAGCGVGGGGGGLWLGWLGAVARRRRGRLDGTVRRDQTPSSFAANVRDEPENSNHPLRLNASSSPIEISDINSSRPG